MEHIDNSAILLPICINGVYIDGFLDSGSNLSFISMDKLEELHLQPLIPCAQQAISLSGHSLNILGMVSSDNVELGNQVISHTFLVISNSLNKVLVGRSFMQQFPFWNMNFTENSLSVSEERFQLLTNQKSLHKEQARVYCLETVEIPEQSSVMIPARINFCPEERIAYFQPEMSSLDHLLFPAHAVIPLTKGATIMISMINPQRYPIRLFKNTQLGLLNPLEVNPETDLMKISCAVDMETNEGRELLDELQDFIRAMENHNDDVTPEQHQQLLELLLEFSELHLFALSRLDVGCIKGVTASLPLEDGVKPISLKAYRLAERAKIPVRKEIQNMKDHQIIRLSASSWCSPVCVVMPTKYSANEPSRIRLTIDYRWMKREQAPSTSAYNRRQRTRKGPGAC